MPKVVIVAEHDPAKELGHTVLWRPGVERIWVRDPKKAHAQVKEHRPQMVVVAVPDAGANATELIRELRTDVDTRPTAIAAIESALSKERQRTLLDAGANAVITHPVDAIRWDPRLEELISVPERRMTQLPVRVGVRRRLAEPVALDGVILNIGIHGLLLEIESPVPSRALLDLAFRLPDDTEAEIVGVGRVARDAGGRSGVYRLGVEFLMLRGAGRGRIHAFVHSGATVRRGADDEAAVERAEREDREWSAVLRDPTLAPALDMEPARLEAWLRRKAIEWRRTVDAIDAPVLIVDAEGRIVRLNRAARECSTARSWDEVTGRRLDDLQGREPWDGMLELASQGLAQNTRIERQVTDAATSRSWALTVGPIERDEHEGEQVVLFARETTGVIKLQAEVKRAELMSTLGALVAGVTHEMRGVLFNMTACLDAFDRVGDHRLIDALRPECDRMLKLSEGLLEYGKPSSAVLQPAPLAPVLDSAARVTRHLADEHHIEIVLTNATELPLVEMDGSRLVQVFQNLLQNAVQHGPEGSRIEISAGTDERGVICTVTDEGPGIDPSHRARVFDPFYSKRPGGTGLGLSIVRRIVEDHRGDIDIQNRPGGGAIVTVRLPAAPSTD